MEECNMELKRIINLRNILIITVVATINLLLFWYKINPVIQQIHNPENVQTTNEEPRTRTFKKHIRNYNDTITQIIERADALKDNELFSDKNGFSYNNIVKTKKDYEPLLNIELTQYDNRAVEEIANYNYGYVISFVLILFIINLLYRDRDNGMWQLTYAAGKGRFELAVKRVGITALVSFVVCGVLYWSCVVMSLICLGGVSQLGAPIQNIPQFGKCTMLINMREYLMLNFLWSFLSIYAFVSIIYMLMTIFRNRKNVIVAMTAFVIVEYLLYTKIEYNSVYSIFKYINVINLFRMSDVCMTYRNIGFSTYVVDLRNVVLIMFAVVIAVSAAVTLWAAANMKPYVKTGIFTKIVQKINEIYQKLLAGMPHIFKEVHKNILTAKGIWILAGVMFATIYFSTTGLMTFTEIQTENDKMYLEYGGEEYSYIEEYVNNEKGMILYVGELRQDAEQKYKNGELSFEDYRSKVQYCELMMDSMYIVMEPMEKLDYLKELEEETGIKGYMMSDRGYEQIFGKSSRQREIILGIVVIIAVILISFASVKLEKYSGVISLASASRSGKWTNHVWRILSCMLVSLIISAITNFIVYFNLIIWYGAPYINAPVQSLTFMRNIPFKITVLQWMILIIAAKLVISIAVSVLSYIVANMITYASYTGGGNLKELIIKPLKIFKNQNK